MRIEKFRPRFPWYGADLQTLRNFIAPPRVDLLRAEAIALPLDDGDALTGEFNRTPGGEAKPLVLLIHGLTGNANSTYMRVSAAAHLAVGSNVLRLNLRGAGGGGKAMYHAGRSEDLAQALRSLDAPHGIHTVGYSLGANMLLKHLGEGAGKIVKAVAVSAPLDLAGTSMRMGARRNRLYHDRLLRQMLEDAHEPPPGISSIWDFDERIVAPRNGFKDAADYYARCSAAGFLDAIAVPTLIVHALDDPWIPPDAYMARDWTRNPRVTPMLASGGGHVGFHEAGHDLPLHDRAAVRFFNL
ncbi:MAG: alpha/beta fold hydrolase [Proteobacteria bacterium]|nr:alpha/beta fold hydrolase [Pseudomonadota bacterium]